MLKKICISISVIAFSCMIHACPMADMADEGGAQFAQGPTIESTCWTTHMGCEYEIYAYNLYRRRALRVSTISFLTALHPRCGARSSAGSLSQDVFKIIRGFVAR